MAKKDKMAEMLEKSAEEFKQKELESFVFINTTIEYSHVNVEDIVVKEQIRSKDTIIDDGIRQLADSIAEKGILQPITVYKEPSDTRRYVLVLGERRYRACKLLNMNQIPTRILSSVPTEEEVRELQLIENIQRSDLDPVDEALTLLDIYRGRVGDYTITPKQLIHDLTLLERNPERLNQMAVGNLPTLCRLSGKSITYLRRLESVLTLPENAIEAVRSGKLNKSQAQVFVENIGHEKFDEVLELALSEEITANGIREAFGKPAKDVKEREPAREPAEQQKRKRGGDVAFFGKRMVMIKKDVDRYQEQMSVEHVQKLVEETKDFLLQLTEILAAKMKST